MIELGKRQQLTVFRKKDNGLYLGQNEEEAILLPAAEAGGHAVGDILDVFVYKDSEDRPIATTKEMPIEKGTVALLPVVQTGSIGAFLDWGLAKNLFLPFHEQRGKVKVGMHIPVILYEDKSGRLAASMKIYGKLAADSSFRENDVVTGLIYEIKPELGAFVAVDGRYAGFIPRQEIYDKLAVGQTVTTRVLKVRPDGKLDLSPRKKAYAQMDEDAARLMEILKSYDGVLPFGEKADPARIQAECGLSKAAFKRAVGRLLKDGLIITGETQIRLKEQPQEQKKASGKRR